MTKKTARKIEVVEIKPQKTKKPAEADKTKTPKAKKPVKQEKKTWLIWTIGGAGLAASGVACLLFALFGLNTPKESLHFPEIPSKKPETSAVYSKLTGEPLASEDLLDSPAYCIQTPNGTDGARPQAGLNQAGVVFEAIAEAGITRFAAIYQNADSGIIGPVRSLRLYYLEWDTPFDCTIVHAGGAPNALQAVGSGEYKNLDENNTNFYRGTVSTRKWNNLFTSPSKLAAFTESNNHKGSEIRGFPRYTPEASRAARLETLTTARLNPTAPASSDLSELKPTATDISLRFGNLASYNVEYHYDLETNRYLRGYESGAAHKVYDCPADLGAVNPESACELTQLAPSVVIAIVVQQEKDEDNYHEIIETEGTGEAYIFQNGGVTHGSWRKDSKRDQIKFRDDEGAEILLAPGQTFISAIPSYGRIDYE